MNKAVLLAALVLFAVAGCGGAGNDHLVKQQIAAMNEFAAALEKNEPADKLAEIRARMEAAGKKLETLKISDVEMKKLIERHEKDMVAAAERLRKALVGKALDGLPALPINSGKS